MNYLNVQNHKAFQLQAVPFIEEEAFYEGCIRLFEEGSRLIAYFNHGGRIYAVLADNASSQLRLLSTGFKAGRFRSFAKRFPHTNYLECELAENTGKIPEEHPWLRPVRHQDTLPDGSRYEFYQTEGEEIHEVAVGPVHAGVIEPGHFRFQCHGEKVLHLEISLGYQHRGVEELMLTDDDEKRLILSESIAGDTTAGHASAYCQALEALSGVSVTLRASVIRSISEELERVAMHLSGLGGIANDVGFAIGASSYGRLRTLIINSQAAICGSRFAKGLFVPGGVRFDLKEKNIAVIKSNLETVRKDVKSINDFMFSSASVLARLEETGPVSEEWAKAIGMTGLAARASGVETDVRNQFPYGAYKYHALQTFRLETGDVYARARMRALEIEESLNYVLERLEDVPAGQISAPIPPLLSNSGVISMTEGWRGEIVHCAFTGEDGKIVKYKVKDPSFHNWYGLGLAVRDQGVSDFPLCNKSFDLSYCGHDL